MYNNCSPTTPRTVERLVSEFKHGRTSIEGDPLKDPNTSLIPTNIAKIKNKGNRRLTERDLEKALHILFGSGEIGQEGFAVIVWDGRGISFVDYVQTAKTINSEYYCNPLYQLRKKNCEKIPSLPKKKSFFISTMHRVTRAF